MSHRKNGLRALGLTIVAALGLMAFMAAGAQANWLFLLKSGILDSVSENELVEVNKHTEDGTLLIEGVNLSILCKTITGNDLLLEPGEATKALASGEVAFSECVGIEKSSGKEVKNCNPINQPINAGGIAHVILHTNGQNYVLLEPKAGKPFATIEFSDLCALTSTSKVTGSTVLECGLLNGSGVFVQEDCNKHQLCHLVRQASPSLFSSDVLKYGTHVASIDGIAGVLLAGKLKGLTWSGEV